MSFGASLNSLPIERSRYPVHAYTDGSCKGNPGPGGWGVYLRWQDQEVEFSGGSPWTTNNQMELQAAIEALERIQRPSLVLVYTDSQYVQKGITQWIHGWKRSDWRSSNGEPIKNQGFWKRLDAAIGFHIVNWKWVKGHSNIPGNERADKLARRETKKMIRFERAVQTIRTAKHAQKIQEQQEQDE